ncbi:MULTISPECIES: hypothetical protein [unclassified Streptomyces]|uniref:hypothetical protein n=1 Tax=unclassified Streptomyces TaxID=2593676 RepID=UPI002366DE2B|nr:MULTISPECIES: hypothetical protein [unclassified Streptomyces]MDF3141492.1 hypothetical protein [Streptomyces sp. T21Q-yed]WDF45027.1 hypothetical protein PBV52_50915 [Streptomyces sp. T12]
MTVDLIKHRPEDEDQDAEHDAEHDEETPATGGGALAQIRELVGPEAWQDLAAQLGALARNIATKTAGEPGRIVRAAWRGTLTVCRRLKDGTGVIVVRLWAWGEEQGWNPLQRLGAAGVAVYVFSYAVKLHPEYAPPAAAVVWGAAALIYAAEKEKEKGRGRKQEERGEETTTQNDHEKSKAGERAQEAEGAAHASEGVPEDTEDREDTRRRKAEMLWGHVEAAVVEGVRDKGKNGAQTADILTRVQKDCSLPGWDEPRFRALLKSIKVPVRDQMHFGRDPDTGKKLNKPGVHVDDLTEALGHTPAGLVPDITPTGPAPTEPAPSPATT